MEYTKATLANIEQVYELVQETIKTIYPRYYPKEAVDFFCHNYIMKIVYEKILLINLLEF